MSPDPPANLPTGTLLDRIEELEAKVAANQARLDAIEGWGRQTASQLQRNVDAMAEETRRARWLRTLRR